jgi:hypothetical protein
MLRYGETGRVWLGRWDSRVAVHEMRETSMEMTKQKRKGFGIDSGSLDLDTGHGTRTRKVPMDSWEVRCYLVVGGLHEVDEWCYRGSGR